jgi:hypothetical protein
VDFAKCAIRWAVAGGSSAPPINDKNLAATPHFISIVRGAADPPWQSKKAKNSYKMCKILFDAIAGRNMLLSR